MILDLCFLGFLTAWSMSVGLVALRRLIEVPKHPADALALAIPLGLGLLAWCVFALGALGVLGQGSIGTVLASGVLLAAYERRYLARLFGSWIGSGGEGRIGARTEPHRALARLFDVILVFILAGTLFSALQPVTDGDALCYHLQVPKVFLEQGRLLYDPDLHETVYPLVVELLDAVGLAWRGPGASRLISWLFGVVLGLSTTALARPMLGSRARWAGTIVLGVPAVSNGMSSALNDVALAACGVAALVAWTEWERTSRRGVLILTGLLCGIALGVKYPALVWTGVLTLASGMSVLTNRGETWPRRCRRALAPMSILACVAFLAGGAWYARAWWHTGNPVHPFFREIFGTGLVEVLEPAKRPLEVTPWNLAIALGAMTLDPARFDSVSHQLGPVFLLLLPGVVLLRPPRAVWRLLVLGFAFFALCLTQRQSMRFILICLGPFAVACAWIVDAWLRRGGIAIRCLVGLLMVILLGEGGLALARNRHGWRIPLGLETAGAYLERKEPTWMVGRWLDANLPREARVIGQEHRGYYLPRPYTMELAHRRRTGLGRQGESAEQVAATLRERGFTHVLFCPPDPEDAVEFDPTLSCLMAPWIAAREPVYRARLTDGDGVVRSYALYELAGQADPVTPSRLASSAGSRP